jgi:hypothetical protein
VQPEVEQQEKEGGMVTFLMETIDDGGKLKFPWRLEGTEESFEGEGGIEGDAVIAIAQAKDQGRPLIAPNGFEGKAVQPQRQAQQCPEKNEQGLWGREHHQSLVQ